VTGTGAPAAQAVTIDGDGARTVQHRGLNPINHTALNGVYTPPVIIEALPEGADSFAHDRYPIGGSPLYLIQAVEEAVTALLVRVYADGRLVHEFAPIDQTMFRLPSGFKAHRYQFEIIGNSNVYSLAVAEVAKELMDV